MKIIYRPPKIEENYKNDKYIKKKYGPEILFGMRMFIGALEAATNAYDVKCLARFQMEHKKGNSKQYYAVTLDKKKSKWRLMLQMVDEEGNILEPTNNEIGFLKSIKAILVGELSEHYGEY